MQKKTSKAMQGRADGTRVLTLENGEDRKLTDDERLEVLKAQVIKMQKDIHGFPKASAERKRIGINLAQINMEIAGLKKNKRPGLANLFMEEAKRLLPRETYSTIEASAFHVYDLRNAPVKAKAAAKHAAELQRAITKMQSPKESGKA